MNQRQQHAIDYLREENRVLREQLGGGRLPFTDNHVAGSLQKRKDSAAVLWPKSQQSSRLKPRNVQEVERAENNAHRWLTRDPRTKILQRAAPQDLIRCRRRDAGGLRP